MGIIGWDVYEPIIIGAVMADIPIMIVGAPGTGKTVAGRAIARAFYGEVNFKAYHCPELHRDALMGFLDIPALQKERKVEFIHDDLSIWDKEAVLLDEPNRAPQSLQHYLLEFIRTRKLLGRPTAARLVMSAMNPPDLDVTATYLTSPMAQRFCYVWAPSLSEFQELGVSADDSNNLFHEALFSNVDDENRNDADILGSLRVAIRVAKKDTNAIYSSGICSRESVSTAIQEVAKVLIQEYRVPFSVRQAKYILRMCERLVLLYIRDKNYDFILNPDVLGRVVHATIPQFYGVVPWSGQGVSSGVIIEGNFLSRMGEILAPVFVRSKFRNIRLGDIVKQGVTGSAAVGFDTAGWASDTLNIMDQMTTLASIRGFQSEMPHIRQCTTIPGDVKDTLVRRWRLKTFALENPHHGASLSELALILGGKKPRGRGDAVCCVEADVGKFLSVWNNKNVIAGSYLAFLAQSGDADDLTHYQSGFYPILIKYARGRDTLPEKDSHRNRVLILTVQDGNPKVQQIIFLDPFFVVDDVTSGLILLTDLTRDSSGRIMSRAVRKLAWGDYTEQGVALFRETRSTPVRVVLNPTWKDIDDIGLSSVLAVTGGF